MIKHNAKHKRVSAKSRGLLAIRARRLELTPKQRAGILLIGIVLLISIANALYFTIQIANPVIRSDAWYNLDSFVSKKLDGSVRWTDYFIKRTTAEVAGPLHKVALTLNINWFGDDFLFESLTGFIAMVICCLYFILVAASAVGRPLQFGEACLIALIPLLHFSLNSTEIYNWSLVIWFYVGLPFGLLLFSVTHRARGKWRTPAILLTCLICLLAMDIGGLLLCFALVVSLILEAIKSGNWRGAISRAVPIVAGGLVYHLGYAAMMPAFTSETAPVTSASAFDFFTTHTSEAWKWAIIPAAASVVHPTRYLTQFGYPMMFATSILVIILHIVFWVSVFRTSIWRHATFVAVCLMLFAYTCTAGVVAGRVPIFGWDYLMQHRYVEYYQLANIALVLHWLSLRNPATDKKGGLWVASSRLQRVRRFLPAATLIAVAVLQGTLALGAWQQVPYVRAYHAGMAQTLFCLADHPEVAAPICEPLHSVCESRPEVRNRLVGLLKNHRLNVFSPEFQTRHGMYPDPDQANRCVPPQGPLYVREVMDVRHSNDPETGERIVLGSILGTGLRAGDVAVINDRTFPTVYGNQTWITFAIPLEVLGNQNSFTIFVLRESTRERSETFKVSYSSN